MVVFFPINMTKKANQVSFRSFFYLIDFLFFLSDFGVFGG
jgi:hypothetical protein